MIETSPDELRIVAMLNGAEVDVTEAVRVTYDTAVSSMDFGSGFLSTDEVAALRTLARALGVDPAPYQHDKCADCGHDRERHRQVRVDAGGQVLGWGEPGAVATVTRCWTGTDGTWYGRENIYGGSAKVDAPRCPCADFAEPT